MFSLWDPLTGPSELCTPSSPQVRNVCKVCTSCKECSGYGASCCARGRDGRTPGSDCGCGGGDSGCADCGWCTACIAKGPYCMGPAGAGPTWGEGASFSHPTLFSRLAAAAAAAAAAPVFGAPAALPIFSFSSAADAAPVYAAPITGGTRYVRYEKTHVREANDAAPLRYTCITTMPFYSSRSQEELRCVYRGGEGAGRFLRGGRKAGGGS